MVLLICSFVLSFFLPVQALATSTTNTYYVYGGDPVSLSGNLSFCMTPIDSGFTYLGSSDDPSTFNESYPAYIITNFDNRSYTGASAPNKQPVYIDALQWSDGTYLQGGFGSSSLADYTNLLGNPDKRFSTLGTTDGAGCIQVLNDNNSTSFTTLSATQTDIIIPSLTFHDVTKDAFTVIRPAAINATNYFLTVATSEDFATPLQNYNNIEITNQDSLTVAGVNKDTTYFSKITATNTNTSSTNSIYSKTSLPHAATYYVYGAAVDETSTTTYTLLGSSSKKQYFSGKYDFYMIASNTSPRLDCNNTADQVFIDTVQWSDGTYPSGIAGAGRTTDMEYALGSPDGKYAVLGKYEFASNGNYSCGGLYYQNTDRASDGITVIPYSDTTSTIIPTIMLLETDGQ